MLDATLLSRIQFAFTISFHILFPAFSIGLITFLAVMEGFWLKTKNPKYLTICKFWTKVFALTFGMGVVSGIVMEFQFGTNWAGFTKSVGPVLGVLFTYEVMTAFFIEAGFLGVMLFGWNRVGPKLHYLATILVMVGTTLSAFWIMSANSWMQDPVGYKLVADHFEVTNWLAVIFNPLAIPRFVHMLLASYILTGFVIAGVCANYLLKKKHMMFSKTCFSFVMWALLIITGAQIVTGDWVGTNVYAHQPIKTAAMEGVWNTQRGAPFLMFAWPDQNAEKNRFEIKIPKVASFLNTREWNGKLVGLKSVDRQDRPFVPIVFFSFRIMVALGFAMYFIVVAAYFLRRRKRLFDTRWFLLLCRYAMPFGFIALWTGWMTAEIGRQPWAVYQLLRTSDAASKVTMSHVMISLGLIILVYGVVFGVFYFYYLSKIMRQGPRAAEPELLDLPFQYMSSGAQDEEPELHEKSDKSGKPGKPGEPKE